MKRFAFILALAGAVIAGGCGSGSSSVQPVLPRFVPISVKLNWPATPNVKGSLALPAESTVIRVTNVAIPSPGPADLIPLATIARSKSTAAYSQTFTTPGPAERPNQLMYYEIQFWSGTNGNGTLIGQIRNSVILPLNGAVGTFSVQTGITTKPAGS